ncbi:hypothetical protein ENBRE01_2472 [Enteropsectra breve]|nr:hypothetical protein ENBRE01_2472 [Enteropsectra breve]
MRFLPLCLFCAATETFLDADAVNKIVEPVGQQESESEESTDCGICLEECVSPSIPVAEKKCCSFPTDLISCKNPINPHFYHKSCIIEWIYEQTDKSILKCPICQEVTSINITSLIKETVFPIITDQASFYPEFIDLIYRVLKSNIFNFLLSEDNFENLEILKKAIKNLKTLKSHTYEMCSVLEKIICAKKEYKEEAINDFKIVYYILKTPCDTMDALLEAVERYATKDTKHEQIIRVLLVNFFTENKPEDFIYNLKIHASTSTHYLKTLKVVNNKFIGLCATKEVIVDLIYSALCTDAYWNIEKISEILPEKISYISLLERKLTTATGWIEHEQKCLALTKSISYCIKHSGLEELRSFLKRMIDKCFAAKVQCLTKHEHIPKNQFMIDFLADFYSSGQQQDTVEEHPWFVYDFICAKILEECLNDDRLYYDIFEYAVEQEVMNIVAGTKEYYFVNVLLDKSHTLTGNSEKMMKEWVNDDRREHISMLMRHCFYRDNVKELFKLVDERMKNHLAEFFFTAQLKLTKFLNFKNYAVRKKYKTVEQIYNKIGLWNGISVNKIEKTCMEHMKNRDYGKIALLIFECTNMDIIKMLDEEAVEKIISTAEFFADLPRLGLYFEQCGNTSLFVRHNFIKIFEMGCKRYAGANKARIMLLLKCLNMIGFNGCSFNEYKHIFKYLSQRDDAFYLLNTGRAHFSEQFGCGLADYITELINESNNFVQINNSELNYHKDHFGKWEMGIYQIAKDTFKKWTLQCAYAWCDKLDERDKSGESWNPYMELERSGKHYIEILKKGCYQPNQIKSKLTAFIPRQVVEKIKEKIKLKSNNKGY